MPKTPIEDELPILLTEGEPIGESVFSHSALEDPTHPEAHRPQDDLKAGTAPPPPDAMASVTSSPSSVSAQLRVHKARLQDARDIFDLVNSLSHDGTLLRRSYAEICENIRDFTVAELPDPVDPTAEPEFLGCGALHLYGPHLAEVRSIVLYPHARGKGAGAALLQSLLAESEEHGVATTCLFTRLPTFFERYGFRVAERNAMPDKIYKDCQACPRLYACDEVAMVKGPLPNIAVLGPIHVKQPKLVQVQLTPTGTNA
jgi:amino-acid N-acetyltransferase